MSAAGTATYTLEITRRLEASRERVFRAWTEAQEVAQWFRPTDDYTAHVVQFDPRPGGRYSIEMRHKGGNVNRVAGHYVEVSAPERLVFTWQFETQADATETLVTIELRAVDGGTELLLRHERFPSEEQKTKHMWGWAGCLDQFTRRVTPCR